jgi:hypothetical protein
MTGGNQMDVIVESNGISRRSLLSCHLPYCGTVQLNPNLTDETEIQPDQGQGMNKEKATTNDEPGMRMDFEGTSLLYDYSSIAKLLVINVENWYSKALSCLFHVGMQLVRKSAKDGSIWIGWDKYWLESLKSKTLADYKLGEPPQFSFYSRALGTELARSSLGEYPLETAIDALDVVAQAAQVPVGIGIHYPILSYPI